MMFYLGTTAPDWIGRLGIPLFVSRRRLHTRRTFPRAAARWALDSGGFTELTLHGRWTVSPEQYADEIDRYADEIGNLDWAAPQDWMCEPQITAQTGKTVAEHQHLTVENYLRLRELGAPVIPVLQGWQLPDYLRCVDLYADAGVDLAACPTVGLGTVCRRQNTHEIRDVVLELHRQGLRLHGFGIKKQGVAAAGHMLTSADSLAWSYNARKNPPLPGCTHQNCNSCERWALKWREDLISRPLVDQRALW